MRVEVSSKKVLLAKKPYPVVVMLRDTKVVKTCEICRIPGSTRVDVSKPRDVILLES
jgi:hypothetical protein